MEKQENKQRRQGSLMFIAPHKQIKIILIPNMKRIGNDNQIVGKERKLGLAQWCEPNGNRHCTGKKTNPVLCMSKAPTCHISGILIFFKK